MSRASSKVQRHSNEATHRRPESVQKEPSLHHTPSPTAASTTQTPARSSSMGGRGEEEEEEEKEEEEAEEKAEKETKEEKYFGFQTPNGSNRAAVELQQGLLLMYRQQRLTDVAIKVGRAIFRCHRVVLCSMSSFFTRLLTEDPERCLVIFKNADAKVFEDVLEYFYTGHLAINDNFDEFLNLVLKLEISSLAGKMDRFLEGNLTSDNCLTVWRYASQKPELNELEGTATKMLLDHFFDEGLTQQLQYLTLPELVHFIEHEDLKASNEEQVVGRALQWLNSTQVTGADAAGLFQRLRLPLCSKDFIRRKVEGQRVVQENPACRDVVTEAMTYVSNPELRHEFHSKRICYRKSNPMVEVMMVFGGYKLSGKTNESVALDLGGREWYPFFAIPQHPGKGMATCVYDNHIYVSGGSGDPQAFWIFVAKDCRWVQGPRLTEGRYKHCMEMLPGGTVCVIGGTVEVEVEVSEGEEEGGFEEDRKPQYEEEPVLEVETLSGSASGAGGTSGAGGVGGGGGGGSEEWRVVMELLIPIYEAASSVSSDGSKIFLYGGKMAEGHPTDSLQCLDLKVRTCTLLSTGLPVACAGAVGLRTNATYFLLASKGEVMRFDPETAKLLRVDKVQYFNRRRFRMICHHERLLVIGGEDGDVQKMMVCLHLDESAVQLVPWENFLPPVRSHFGLAKILVSRRFLGEPQW